MRFANTMPGVAVVGDVGVITDFSGQAARLATATPGMVLPYQYEDSGIGSPWVKYDTW